MPYLKLASTGFADIILLSNAIFGFDNGLFGIIYMANFTFHF